MKYLLILAFLAGIFIYLNRSYAYFYHFQDSHFIANPYYPPLLEFKNQKSSDHAKLVIMGDSLMVGTGSTSVENSLAYLIAKNIAGGKNLTLINIASPGVGTEDLLLRQVPEVIKDNPDYVVLMIGINDVHNKVNIEIFRERYSQILNQLSTRTQAKIVIINIPFIGSDKILLPPWNYVMDSQIKKFNNVIQSQASENKLEVINLYDQFVGDFKKSSDLYSDDQFHPSDKGYALWANYVNENINN